jgi:putative ABC transport system ATP-binding protein
MRAADVLLRLDHGEVVDPRRSPAGAAPLAGRPSSVEADADAVLRLTEVAKTYRRGTDLVHAVDGVSLEVLQGELVGLIGRSGSGKTTLLNLVAGWEQEDRGTIEGPAVATNGASQWKRLAVVPQKLGLIDELTVRENVAHPAKLDGSLEEHADRVEELLERFGLADLAGRHPSEASVGEQQRAAVARALLLHPTLVIADEPTGHQDRGWTERVFAAIRDACDAGTSCLMATHDETATRYLDRTLPMKDGAIDTGSPT